MEKLPRKKSAVAERENVILQSLFIARTRHSYPGYLGDWEHVLEHVNGTQRNGHSARPGRKQVNGESVVKRR
jgi:hypothetical protein